MPDADTPERDATNTDIVEQRLSALVDDADFQELDRRFRRFNLFEAIGGVRGELRHSNFLAFLLSPARPHGVGIEFLQRLLRAILAKMPPNRRPVRPLELIVGDLEGAVVHRERDNIDLLIEIKELALTVAIENKIGASVGDGQLARYRRVVEQQAKDQHHLFVLLTPAGTEPDEPDYVPFSYVELADLIQKLIDDRGGSLSGDVVLILKHYTEMLRRHIVEDEKLTDLARKLYERHKEAFDFVAKCQPEPETILDDIWELVGSNGSLKQDRRTPSYLNFAPSEWSAIADLNACPATEWTKTRRSLLFEVKSHGNGRISVSLIIGPSDPASRERIYLGAAQRPKVFRRLVKPMGRLWSTIYSRDLVSAAEAKTMSPEEQAEAVTLVWQKFLSDDLPMLKTGISEVLSATQPGGSHAPAIEVERATAS